VRSYALAKLRGCAVGDIVAADDLGVILTEDERAAASFVSVSNPSIEGS
jgi:hypothetical protein